MTADQRWSDEAESGRPQTKFGAPRKPDRATVADELIERELENPTRVFSGKDYEYALPKEEPLKVIQCCKTPLSFRLGI